MTLKYTRTPECDCFAKCRLCDAKVYFNISDYVMPKCISTYQISEVNNVSNVIIIQKANTKSSVGQQSIPILPLRCLESDYSSQNEGLSPSGIVYPSTDLAQFHGTVWFSSDGSFSFHIFSPDFQLFQPEHH
jgi:hypothetical protein